MERRSKRSRSQSNRHASFSKPSSTQKKAQKILNSSQRSSSGARKKSEGSLGSFSSNSSLGSSRHSSSSLQSSSTTRFRSAGRSTSTSISRASSASRSSTSIDRKRSSHSRGSNSSQRDGFTSSNQRGNKSSHAAHKKLGGSQKSPSHLSRSGLDQSQRSSRRAQSNKHTILGCTPVRNTLIILAILLIVVSGLFVFDLVHNWNKIYSGVTIGEVDVSGMTREEAAQAVDEYYSEPFASNEVLLFANQETADEYVNGVDVFNEEQYTEDQLGSSRAWRIDSNTLQATLDIQSSAEEAFQIGRGDHRFTERFGCIFGGVPLTPVVHIERSALDPYALKVDSISGIVRHENEVVIDQGFASVVPGQDGYMVNPDEFRNKIIEGLLSTSGEPYLYVPQLYDTPMSYSLEVAQACADSINNALLYPVTFVYGDASFEVSQVVVGSWIDTKIDNSGGDTQLVAFIDVDQAQNELMFLASEQGIASTHNVHFDTSTSPATVYIDGDELLPQYREALVLLNSAYFGSESPVLPVSITIPSGPMPESLSFDEAIDRGVITKISSFTTEYTPDDLNRNFNIHHMSDLLNGSVCYAQQTWSILETAGEIGEDFGYKPAGQILDGEVVEDFGGGVCQVATTVFNAVYESGFPVVARYNHSLYMSVYPDGRDAAIAWPYLDLVWKNDTDSDVMVITSYTDTTITVELWGVDPGYVVQSETGEWKKGDPYKIKLKYSESQSKEKDTVEKKGKDGKNITVVRTVSDKNGTILHEDLFYSAYDPVNSIVVRNGSAESKIVTQEEYTTMIEKEKAEKEKEKAEKEKTEKATENKE